MTRRFIRRIAIAAVSAFALAALVPVAAVNAAAASDAVPTVIVLDASGSMVRDAAGGGSRMDQAKQATTAVVDALAGSVDLGLLVFGTGTSNNDADKAAGCSDVKTLATVGPVDAAALKAEISAIKASGFTPLGPSMKQAAAMLPQSGPANIVLVSDGVDTCSPPPACEVASDLRALNSELTIHVVGFAVDADEQAQAQLQCIGAVGGGTYVTAGDAKQLAARLSAAVTSNSSSTQLSNLGAHGVRLGDTLDQARTALGTSARITSTETIDGVEIQWVECDWGRVMLRDGRIFGLLPNDGDQTAEGIAVGASLADAEAIYGSAVHTGSDSLGDWSVFALRAGSPQGYRLYNDGKSVTKIVLCLCVPVATSTSDLASWEVSMEAVGPLKLGAPATDVTSLFPSATVKSSYDNTQDVYSVLADPANTWRRVDVTVDKASSTISAITVGVEETLYSASTSTYQKGTPELAGPSLPHLAGMRVGDSSRTAKNVFPGMTAFGNQQTQADGLVLTDRDGRVLRIGTEKVSSTSGKRDIGGGNIVSFTISDGSTWKSYYYDN